MSTMFLGAFLVCALSINAACAAAAKPAGNAHAPAEQQREITYADLEQQLGKRVNVYTKLGTLRSGILTKYTQSSINIKLDGGAELSITADAIRGLSVPAAPPDPLFQTPDAPSAKTK